MDTSKVVMVDIKKEKAWIGSYIDGKFYLFYDKNKSNVKLRILLRFDTHLNFT